MRTHCLLAGPLPLYHLLSRMTAHKMWLQGHVPITFMLLNESVLTCWPSPTICPVVKYIVSQTAARNISRTTASHTTAVSLPSFATQQVVASSPALSFCMTCCCFPSNMAPCAANSDAEHNQLFSPTASYNYSIIMFSLLLLWHCMQDSRFQKFMVLARTYILLITS